MENYHALFLTKKCLPRFSDGNNTVPSSQAQVFSVIYTGISLVFFIFFFFRFCHNTRNTYYELRIENQCSRHRKDSH